MLDVVAIEGAQKQLERLSDMLTAVQKALGDYLEKQRSQFARFYFVGDEDLLEMIGNSKDVATTNRHLRKMFAGVASLVAEPDAPDVLKAMRSKEGELVDFVEPVRISNSNTTNHNITTTTTTTTTSSTSSTTTTNDNNHNNDNDDNHDNNTNQHMAHDNDNNDNINSFVEPVRISADPAINAWLSKMEAAMHGSLGEHLSAATIV